MSYGASDTHAYRRAASHYVARILKGTAYFVHRILKGAKPAELPVEFPTKVEARCQPDNCQGTRPRNPAQAARARRRGDRVNRRESHIAARRRGGGVAGRGVGARDHGRGRLRLLLFLLHQAVRKGVDRRLLLAI
jgi:hypothetical protein